MCTKLSDGYLKQLRWTLIGLSKKINRIEDKYPNYMENKKWIKCREQQDEIYAILRKHNEVVENENGRNL